MDYKIQIAGKIVEPSPSFGRSTFIGKLRQKIHDISSGKDIPQPKEPQMNDSHPATQEKIKLTKIEFTDLKVECSSMTDADTVLREEALKVKGPGFNKVNYMIHWEDGKYYRGFFPLFRNNNSSERLLSVHLSGEFLMKGGVVCPRRMSQQEYMEHLRMKNEKYPGYSELARKLFLIYEW